MKKLLLPFALLLGVGAVIFMNKAGIFTRPYNFGIQDSLRSVEERMERTITGFTDTVKEEIPFLAPPPIRAKVEESRSFLTRAGVVLETNRAREASGQSPFLEDIVLNAAAEAKAGDLLTRQYFEHVSPSGLDAADLVKAVGYDYIAIGENLALGNYKDDAALVAAWLESPGHRENILNQRFKEIGAAVKKGTFEGRSTWVGVQIFARPRSSCPPVDGGLRSQIESADGEIDALSAEADRKRAELESRRPAAREEYELYRQEVEVYNEFVRQINELVVGVKELTQKYNQQVDSFNRCAAE